MTEKEFKELILKTSKEIPLFFQYLTDTTDKKEIEPTYINVGTHKNNKILLNNELYYKISLL